MGTVDQYEKNTSNMLNELKLFEKPNDLVIPVYDNSSSKIADLVPINVDMEENDEAIKLLARWREENADAYPTQFKVTEEGTKKWLRTQLIERKDRILFFIQSLDNMRIGHLGLSEFDFSEQSCEIDNVVRGRKTMMKGIMTLALNTLLNWSVSKLELKRVYLRVFLDNERAIALYKRCGFKELAKIPLRRIEEKDIIKFIDIEDNSFDSADRYFLKMIWKPKQGE